jgi:proteasome lid subunit RPN8/RPN11
MLAIETSGQQLIGIVHSHPHTDATPSLSDRREARYAVPHLIVGRLTGGPGDPQLRAWWLRDADATEVELELADQQGSLASTIRPPTASSTRSTSHDPSSFPER